jgi:hypothetical protein
MQTRAFRQGAADIDSYCELRGSGRLIVLIPSGEGDCGNFAPATFGGPAKAGNHPLRSGENSARTPATKRHNRREAEQAECAEPTLANWREGS